MYKKTKLTVSDGDVLSVPLSSSTDTPKSTRSRLSAAKDGTLPDASTLKKCRTVKASSRTITCPDFVLIKGRCYHSIPTEAGSFCRLPTYFFCEEYLKGAK